MSTATLNVYNLLMSAGIENSIAKDLAEEIVTREEASNFTTKGDLKDLRLEIYRVAIGQSAFIVAAIGLLLVLIK